MDHGGQFEREGRTMSQVQTGGVDLCDNLPNPEALAAQTRNLNETDTLTQARSVSPSQNEDGGRCGSIQKTSLNNNGKEEEMRQGKDGYTGRSREEEEEEDIDEMMKEEDEEEESEESSCLNFCQSPDTPMTDSSYSETGSLLETPYPFSPGTSPEPTSPVIPAVSPETVYPISSAELIQSDAEMDTHNLLTRSGASSTGSTFTTGPMDCTSQTITSGTEPTCLTERIAKNTNSTTEQLTSSTEPVLNCGSKGARGSASSHTGPNTSAAETFTLTALAKLNTSTASTPVSASQEPLNFTAGLTTTGTDSTSTTNQERITSTPVTTCFSVSACASGPIPGPALLETLEQLAQRGDDIHLPQSLHQVAEAFVLHGDYQRALWCIQLERLYHQRVLDNLNALQQQWASQFKRTPSDLATQHLDSLKHICQTHNRPRTRDAECASLNFVGPKFEEGGALHSYTSAHQVEGGMEQRAEDSSCSVMPSVNLPDGLSSPELSGKDREHPARESEGRNGFHGSQHTDEQGNDREGREAEGGVGCTISGDGLHPSTAGGMDQSKPAEQQGQDLGPAQETEAKEGEEGNDVEEATEALEMEDDGEEEEGEEKKKERDTLLSQKTLPVETVCSGAEVEVQQLHQDAGAQKQLHVETQESTKASLYQEVPLPHEAYMKQQELYAEMKEVEEEEDYDLDQADIIREAPSLDEMAKLITVEEISPASGLVSILKKRSVCVDVSTSSSSEPQPEKPTAKRRVRFKVPEDHYEPDVGSGDSCLLLFLLCLVTVFISVGGTALYCALGDAQSSVCQDFFRNADFYIKQIQHGITQIQHWYTPGS
ncbi:consortin [Archocentrus centrarchus]|uniref:consortin n=1 Tax=Archocentrus centrarchus TaxID=63155 RepID=UPI0011E9CC9A|nr:consortin [Archocentrus centrarchus]